MGDYVSQSRFTSLGLSWKTWTGIPGYREESQGDGTSLPWRNVNTESRYLSLQDTRSFRTSGEVDAKAVREGYFNARMGREERPTSTFDNGHEFSTQKRSGWFSHRDFSLQSTPVYTGSQLGSNSYYRGFLAPRKSTTGTMEHPVITPLTSSEIGYLGSQAINRTIPTHPSTGLATIVGELKEGLPSLIGAAFLRDKADFFRSLGGEYLNIEFGWKPFINDILSIIDSVNTASKQLTQYQRDSGRNVRRAFQFMPVISNQMIIQDAAPYLGQPFWHTTQGNYFSTVGKYSLNRYVNQRTWFKGAYTYHVEAGKSDLDRLVHFEQMANRLLGTRITPEVLWELTPWSWLVDWVSNVGHVVSNYSAFQADGLVLRYGYLMRHTVVQDTHTNTGTVTAKNGHNLGTVTMTLRTERKERVRATPYGFGLNPNLFTDRQWAILAALGMTKSPRSLR